MQERKGLQILPHFFKKVTGLLPKWWKESKLFYPPINSRKLSDKHCASFLQLVARAVSLVDRTGNTEEMTFSHGQDESLRFVSAGLMSILSSLVVCGIYFWIILDTYWALRPARWVIPKRIIATKGAKDLWKGRGASKDKKPQQGDNSIWSYSETLWG